MTKNERSLQWVIAGIFFVVCFAFFQWIYPNHLFFKEQMRIFLYTTDYFILKSASNLNGNLNGSKELEHYAS